ncbi:MAG TPA: hypothetical protein VJX67_27770 [Blastocatellia bacterium]|nr:hypothetical protein [Blastocatellia bacterium]
MGSKAEITESYRQGEGDQEEENLSGAPVAWRLFIGKKVVEIPAGS